MSNESENTIGAVKKKAMIREGIEKMIKGKNRNIKFEQVYSMENLVKAYKAASKTKRRSKSVLKFEEDFKNNLLYIQSILKNRSYSPSSVVQEEVVTKPCNKKRLLTKIPFFPDQIIHHALLSVILPVLQKYYYEDSFAGIKGRGQIYGKSRVERWIRRHEGYWFSKTDIIKFYQSIDQEKCYVRICKLFKDDGIRWLVRNLIQAISEGLGIGIPTVQPFANLYLTDLDRDVNKIQGVHTFRYCDDILIIGESPNKVREALSFIEKETKLIGLKIHEVKGIGRITELMPADFIGFLFYQNRTFLRRKTKIRIKHAWKKSGINRYKSMCSYRGWMMHSNCYKLWIKITGMKKFSDLKIKQEAVDENGRRFFDAPQVSCSYIVDRPIVVEDFEPGVETKNGGGRYAVLCTEAGRRFKFFTNNPKLKRCLDECERINAFPFEATLRMKLVSNGKKDYYFE